MAFHIHIHKCVVVVDTIGIPLSDTFPVMVVRSAEENGERERERALHSIRSTLFYFYFIAAVMSNNILLDVVLFFSLFLLCVGVCEDRKGNREKQKKQQQQIHSFVGPTLNTIDFIEICLTSLYIVVMHITYGRFHSASIFFSVVAVQFEVPMGF